MAKTMKAARYMSCPRNCGIDVRDHNSSGLIAGGCDTDANPAANCAYPDDTENAHDHADCLDALEEMRNA